MVKSFFYMHTNGKHEQNIFELWTDAVSPEM
jgi:hypothetical protein